MLRPQLRDRRGVGGVASANLLQGDLDQLEPVRDDRGRHGVDRQRSSGFERRLRCEHLRRRTELGADEGSRGRRVGQLDGPFDVSGEDHQGRAIDSEAVALAVHEHLRLAEPTCRAPETDLPGPRPQVRREQVLSEAVKRVRAVEISCWSCMRSVLSSTREPACHPGSSRAPPSRPAKLCPCQPDTQALPSRRSSGSSQGTGSAWSTDRPSSPGCWATSLMALRCTTGSSTIPTSCSRSTWMPTGSARGWATTPTRCSPTARSGSHGRRRPPASRRT